MKGKSVRRMIKENGKIKEISENEAFCMFIDNEYYMAMDFYELRNRLEEAGAKIKKRKKTLVILTNLWYNCIEI